MRGAERVLDAIRRYALMERALAGPVLVDEISELVERPSSERAGHGLRQLAHARQRADDARHPLSIGIEHRRDGDAGNPRLTRVGHDAPALELTGQRVVEGKRSNGNSI